MMKLPRTPIIPVWVVLMVATAISWQLGADHGGGSHATATVIVLIVAFVKVSLIGEHFMELRHAPPWLRYGFQGWAMLACAALVGLYLAS